MLKATVTDEPAGYTLILCLLNKVKSVGGWEKLIYLENKYHPLFYNSIMYDD